MKRFLFFAVLIVSLITLNACSTDRTVAPETHSSINSSDLNQEQVAADIMAATGWLQEDPEALPQPDPKKCSGRIVGYDRTEVVPGIAHYRLEIQVGSDPLDRIALHRVVKERRPGHPIHARKAIFLQHGDAKDFTGMFLPGTLSPTMSDDFGAAIYWAQHNLDVWGIDQAWNLVPHDTEVFDFMANWGVEKQAQDLGTAVGLARLLRWATGNGHRKMILLGYSSGSVTGYALLNTEAQLPAWRRQVGGWIPVDYSPVSDNDDWNQIANCDFVPIYQDMIANGEYGAFVGFDFMGVLARDDPDGDSPIFPGFTNLQAAMFMGAGPIFGVGDIHYLAGVWENEMPVGFSYLDVDQWLDFMIAGTPYEPTQFFLDYCLWSCPDWDVPWDDNFSDITVPVLNIGAAGGLYPITGYCLTLLGSSDITDQVVQLEGSDEALYDYGHIDLWMAYNAPQLVWDPIMEWVSNHTANGHAHGHHHNH